MHVSLKRHKWITTDTWAQVILKRFKLNESSQIDVSELILKAWCQTVVICHLHDTFHQHGKKGTYGFIFLKDCQEKSYQAIIYLWLWRWRFLHTVITRSKVQLHLEVSSRLQIQLKEFFLWYVSIEECSNLSFSNYFIPCKGYGEWFTGNNWQLAGIVTNGKGCAKRPLFINGEAGWWNDKKYQTKNGWFGKI